MASFPIHIGDLHLVVPALNLYIPDADILIKLQQVRLFSLNIMDYSMSFVLLTTLDLPFGGQLEKTILRHSIYTLSFFVFFVLLHYKKFTGGLKNFSVSPSPVGNN